MIKWILDRLNLTYTNEHISDLRDRLSALEEGVMHDDYPKCTFNKDAAWSICKHGRAEFNAKEYKPKE